MQIDWFTVIAQIINFLILVWLLKRFLYKPVLDAIDEREKKIAAQLNNAEAKMTLAQKEQDDFRQKNETFDRERAMQMDKATREAEAERQNLLEAARNEAGSLRSKLEKALVDDVRHLNGELKRKVQQEVFEISGKTLTDLASVRLEEQLVSVFTSRVEKLDEQEKQQFKTAFKNIAEAVGVTTAFNLPLPQRTLLEASVKKIIGMSAQFQYEVSPELISGIEINAGGYKLSWNIAAYLASMQKDVNNLFSQKHKTEKKDAGR